MRACLTCAFTICAILSPSSAARSGMSLPFIGALLGHRELATTNRYVHLMNDPLKQAANTVANAIDEAMKGASKQEPGKKADVIKLNQR